MAGLGSTRSTTGHTGADVRTRALDLRRTSSMGETRRWNTSPYAGWVAALARESDPIAGSETLHALQAVAEELYLGLRTCEGVPLAPPELDHVRPWVDAGWAAVDVDGRLRLTASGWLRLDALANDLTLFRSRY